MKKFAAISRIAYWMLSLLLVMFTAETLPWLLAAILNFAIATWQLSKVDESVLPCLRDDD